MKIGALSLLLLIAGLSALAGSYGSFKGVVFHGCCDGDTCTFTIPGMHPLLGEKIKVRLRRIDTPEIRGKCEQENALAVKARDALVAMLKDAPRIDLVDVKRGKYFRIIATGIADGVDAGKVPIEKGWARLYEGGMREGWCTEQ